MSPPVSCAAGRHVIQCAARVEAMHPDRVLDRVAADDADARPGGRRDDRNNVEIQPRRGAPVQAHFLEAGVVPLRKRGEVEEAQVDGLLDLVGEVAGQQHGRDVRVDPFDALDRMGIRGRVQQSADERLVLLQL